MSDIVPIVPAEPVTIAQAIASFLAEPNPNTRRTYACGLERFAEFIGAENGADAAQRLCGMEHGRANLVALQYRQYLMHQGLSANTIELRLNTLRAVTKLARRLGAISWSLDVEGVGVKLRRKTAGPGVDNVLKMIAATEQCADPRQAARDKAILCLLFDLGLRRQSVVDLDLADLNESRELRVKIKAQHDPETFALEPVTYQVLCDWIELRGREPGPMFIRLDRASKSPLQRISGETVRQVVKHAAARVGVDTHPHGLRHTAATLVAAQSGSVFEVQAFLRHSSPTTARHYVDDLNDLGLKAARRVAAARTPAVTSGGEG